MKQVLGAYLISGGGLANLRGGLAPAGPLRDYGPVRVYVLRIPQNNNKYQITTIQCYLVFPSNR